VASAVVGALRVLLSLDTAEFDTAMKRASSSAKVWSDDLNNMGRQATAVGSALTRTITLPLVGMGLAAVKAASDFESSFAGVRKTVDATEPEFEALAQGLRDMSKEIPTNVNELNKVAEAAGQLGIKKDDILQFTRTMADLGVTTNLTADEAATATAQIQNIFGAAGKDVDRFGATLVALGNAGASTEKDIIEMGKRIAGAGHQVGLTQAQVLSFASALSSVGINSEAGGTAISRVFLKINDAVASGGKGLAEFARVADMSSLDFKEAWQTNAAGATATFISGLGRLKTEGENVNATIEGLVGRSINIKDALLRASGAGQLLTEQLAIGNKAWAENTALTEEAGKRYQTFESQLQVLWNQVKDVAITLGMSLLPIMKDLVAAATPAVQMVGRLAEGFAELPEPIRMTALAMGAVTAAIGPLIWGLGSLMTAAGTVIKVFTAKGAAAKILTTAFGETTVAAGTTAGAFTAMGSVVSGIGTVLGGVARLMTGVVGGAVVGLDLSIRALTDNTSSLMSVVSDIATVIGDLFVRAASAAWEVTKDWSSAMATFVTDTGASFLTWLRDSVPQINAAVTGFNALAYGLGLVTKEGTSYWAEQAQYVRDQREVATWSGKTAENLTKQAQSFKVASYSVDIMADSNRVLAGEYAKADAASAAHAQQTALTTEEIKKAKKANDERMDGLRKAAELESRMVQENAAFRAEAIKGIDDEAKAWRDYYNWLGERRMENDQAMLPIASTMDVAKMFAPYKAAIKETSLLWKKSFDNIGDAFKNIGSTILQAVQGGGDVLGSIGSSFGLAIGKDLSENLGGFLEKNLGKTIGAAFTTMLPGLGALLGPAISAIGSGLKKLFGFGASDEVKKYNAEIDNVKKGLIDLHGPMEELEAKANAVGLSFAENWGHQGKEGLAAFNELIDEFNKRWAELDAQREKLNADLQTTQDELDGLIGKARDLGYEFDQNGQFIGVSFDTVKAKAEEFGVSVDGLGGKFRQLGIDAEARRIIDGFTLMEKAGGDVGGILVGMKDEIANLVRDSIRFGTTIPKNMEPWIKELIRTDQLVDSNGKKITDISNLKFGDPVKTEFEKISTALLEVVNKLNEILQSIAAIPTQKTVTVTTVHRDVYEGDGGGGSGGEPPPFSTGTMGRLGTWFGNFPSTGMAAVLHGTEAVVTAGQAPAFAMDVLSSMGMGGGGGSNDGLLYEIQGLRRDLQTTIPALSESAARHGAQTGGRRR
jgi:TP901 family phage tail tape measure protein